MKRCLQFRSSANTSFSSVQLFDHFVDQIVDHFVDHFVDQFFDQKWKSLNYFEANREAEKATYRILHNFCRTSETFSLFSFEGLFSGKRHNFWNKCLFLITYWNFQMLYSQNKAIGNISFFIWRPVFWEMAKLVSKPIFMIWF
jgi:hypothetical protein